MDVYSSHQTNEEIARKMAFRCGFPVHFEKQADGNLLAVTSDDKDDQILAKIGFAGLEKPNFVPIRPPKPWGV